MRASCGDKTSVFRGIAALPQRESLRFGVFQNVHRKDHIRLSLRYWHISLCPLLLEAQRQILQSQAMAVTASEFHYRSIELLKSEHIGSGSYGGVCKARCDGLLCAAKIVHPTLFDPHDPGASIYLSKFWNECQLLSLVRHPNIVQYLAVCYDPDTQLPVLLMELCDENLSVFLERSPGPLSYHIQVNICHDIALALVYLHSNGLIHRDLTGNNVLMLPGPRAKITDFGMSKLASANPRMSALTLCPGNLLYMPPEALDDTKSYTSKLDIFSAGVIIIQIITREFPNPGKRLRQVFVPQFDEPLMQVVPERERRLNHISLIPDTHSLKPLALHCLERKEKQRPSADDICENLSQLKQSSHYLESFCLATEDKTDVPQREHQLQEQRSVTGEEETQLYKAESQELRATIDRLQRKLEQMEISRSPCNQQSDKTLVGESQSVHSISTEKELLKQQLQESQVFVSESQQDLKQRDATLKRRLSLGEEKQFQVHSLQRRYSGGSVLESTETGLQGLATTSITYKKQSEKATESGTQGVATTTTTYKKQSEKATESGTQGVATTTTTDKKQSEKATESGTQGVATTTTTYKKQSEKATEPGLQELGTPADKEQSSGGEIGSTKAGLQGLGTTTERESFSGGGWKEEEGMSWREGEAAPQRMCRGSVVVSGDTAYFRPASSQSVFTYNRSSGEWSSLTQNPHRSFSLVVIDGCLTGVGGWDRKKATGCLLSFTGGEKGEGEGGWVEMYPPLPTPRRSTTCFTTDSTLITVGGYGLQGDLDIVELMKTETKEWCKCCPLPQKFSQLSGAIHGNKLYLAGGYRLSTRSRSVLTCSINDLRPASSSLGSKVRRGISRGRNAWKEIGCLSVTHSTLVSFRGDLLAIGGEIEPQTPTSSIYRHNSQRDCWEIVSETGECNRSWCFAVSWSDDQLMVVGGCSTNSLMIDNVHFCMS